MSGTPRPPDQGDYHVVAKSERDHRRTELREYPDRFVMLRLLRRQDGSWYVRDRIEVPRGPERTFFVFPSNGETGCSGCWVQPADAVEVQDAV